MNTPITAAHLRVLDVIAPYVECDWPVNYVAVGSKLCLSKRRVGDLVSQLVRAGVLERTKGLHAPYFRLAATPAKAEVGNREPLHETARLCNTNGCHERAVSGSFCHRHSEMAGAKGKRSGIPLSRLMGGRA